MDRVPAPDTSPHLTKFGGWVALPTLISVEALARAGMDFVTLDLQHGALDFHDAAAAIQLLDAIAATPGLAGLFVGPMDLALALGAEPGHGPESRRWQGVITRVLALGRTHHLETGMVAADGEEAARWASRGFSRVVIGSDVGLLRHVIAFELARARGASDATTAVRGSTVL